MKTLIGLNGVAKSGKDTLAYLLSAGEPGIHCFSFSDELYREVAEAFGVDEEMLRRQSTKETPTYDLMLANCGVGGFIMAIMDQNLDGDGVVYMRTPRSPRQILQWWGTEYRRRIDPGYWVTRARLWYEAQPGGVYINTSARFVNEVGWIKSEGGEIWQVVRPGYGAINEHVSDAPLPPEMIDRVINNNGTVEDLAMAGQRALRWAQGGIEKVAA